MKLRLVPAPRGALWMRQGLRTVATRPLSFMGLFGVLLLGMLVASQLPWVGPVLFWASLPLVALGFMQATQQVLQGRFPSPRVFLEPFRGERAKAKALWQLGVLYAGTMLVVVLIYTWIDNGRMQALQLAATSVGATPESVGPLLRDSRLLLGLLWFATASSLLSLPFWHAPALVYWGGQSMPKSLFFSTVACWRNKAAFAVYVLTGLGAVMAFALASSLLFAALGQPNLAPVVMMPAMLMFTLVFYASLFFTFADCFEMTPMAEEPITKTEP